MHRPPYATLTLLLCLLLSTPQPLRLHIRAASNSPIDQRIKLEVRNALLQTAAPALENTRTRIAARKQLMTIAPALLDAAQAALKKNGAHYGASLGLAWESFPEKNYADKTYKAGRYEALRVELGGGGGENWWCVMYPPLCIGELEPDEPVVFKSAIAELIQRAVK